MANRRNIDAVAQDLGIEIEGKTDAAAAKLILDHQAAERSRETLKFLSRHRLTPAILQEIIASGNHTTATHLQTDRGTANGKKKKGRTSRDLGSRMSRR